jgi:DNA-binding LacI/PurR family transcriptional regulator
VEPEVYRGSPEKRLEALTARLSGAVWILHRSTPAMQDWFQASGVRAVLAGARHTGILLPQVELDYHAISRHAAGQLIAHGHRCLALLQPEGALAGDAECASAFREAAGTAEVLELRCRAGTTGVKEALRPLLRPSRKVTGLYVLHADHCVTALTFLQREGIAIPAAMSLICRDDAPYLDLLCPEPARYRYSIRALSSRLAAMVAKLHSGPPKTGLQALILPRFISGETVAGRIVP